MKRNGLRALGLVTCAVVFISLIGVAVDYSDPAYVIENELIEEISNAAGLALVNDYIADYDADKLAEFAATGRTPGIRLAADRALFVINSRELELYGMELDELATLAEGGDQDAANMWFFKSRAGYKRPELVEEYIASATVETLEYAAGVLLGGFYVPNSPLGAKTEDELVELAKNGESLGLRVAAATALTAIWVADQPLTIDEVRKEILSITLVYPELGLAYQGYLAYLFSL
jgi:hypothetical protein